MDPNTAAVWFAAICAATVVSLVAVIAWAVVSCYEIKHNVLVDLGEGWGD
jgi:hypothetical protein